MSDIIKATLSQLFCFTLSFLCQYQPHTCQEINGTSMTGTIYDNFIFCRTGMTGSDAFLLPLFLEVTVESSGLLPRVHSTLHKYKWQWINSAHSSVTLDSTLAPGHTQTSFSSSGTRSAADKPPKVC